MYNKYIYNIYIFITEQLQISKGEKLQHSQQ